MIHIEHFRNLVVRPTLEYINMYSAAAEELLIGTAVQESRLTYLTQLDGNDDPYDNALGVYQMEVKTHNDIIDNYVIYRSDLLQNILRLASSRNVSNASERNDPGIEIDPKELIINLAYATALCRIHYRRCPGALPDADDVQGLARYWKDNYNTAKGKGTVDEFIDHYFQYVRHGGN